MSQPILKVKVNKLLIKELEECKNKLEIETLYRKSSSHKIVEIFRALRNEIEEFRDELTSFQASFKGLKNEVSEVKQLQRTQSELIRLCQRCVDFLDNIQTEMDLITREDATNLKARIDELERKQEAAINNNEMVIEKLATASTSILEALKILNGNKTVAVDNLERRDAPGNEDEARSDEPVPGTSGQQQLAVPNSSNCKKEIKSEAAEPQRNLKRSGSVTGESENEAGQAANESGQIGCKPEETVSDARETAQSSDNPNLPENCQEITVPEEKKICLNPKVASPCKAFACGICSMRFHLKIALNMHQKKEHPRTTRSTAKLFPGTFKAKRIKSSVAKTQIKRNASRSYNLRSSTSNAREKVAFKFPIKKKTGDEKHGLDSKANKLGLGPNMKLCKCGRLFGNEARLNRHLRYISTKKIVTCEFCKKQMSSPDILRKHKLICPRKEIKIQA